MNKNLEKKPDNYAKMYKSKNAILYKIKSKLKIKNIFFPEPKSGQVLVKLDYSGVCASQVMEIMGGRNNKKYIPHFLGHEGVGRVFKIGKNVKKVKVGQDVILTWLKCKGANVKNSQLIFKKKKINFGPITTFGEYSLISENRLLVKPKNINKKISSLFGCALATGAGMAINETKIKKNDKVLVYGLGGIGFSCLITLISLGVKNITVWDINKKRILIAKKMGIKNVLKNEGNFDICFESCGKIDTIEHAFKLLKTNGKLIFSSHPDKNLKIKILPHDLIKGKRIIGSWGGSTNLEKDIKKIYNIIKKNIRYFDFIIKKVYKIEDINLAINDLIKGKVIRPLIKF